MKIEAKVIEDSVAPNGKRLTTLQLVYPRLVHQEFLTHRVFSRNASSSRAIPVAKMISATLEDPAFFVHVGKNQKGMQAFEEVSAEIRDKFEAEWNDLARIVAGYVSRWSNDYGIHKQVANRALEPWQHIHVVLTSTEWSNFFELRNHPDAQPEIKALAEKMLAALNGSTPILRTREREFSRGWHLPYVSVEERIRYRFDPLFLAKLSVARCARVSYLLHDGTTPTIEKDLELYERLVGSRPLHASPTEHQAYPLPLASQRSKNFAGWRQHRELVEQEIYSADAASEALAEAA